MEPQPRKLGLGKPQVPGVKRQRISNACNQCRKRKVRCDEAQPSCRNCFERNEECITTNLRTQEVIAIRRRTNKNSTNAVSGAATITNQKPQSPAQRVAYASPEEEAWQASLSTSDGNWTHNSSSGSTPSRHGIHSEVSPAFTRAVPKRYEMNPPPYSYNQETIINKTGHHKRKFIGGGTLQALSKYLDRYFECRGLESVGPRFVYGMQHAEEFVQPKLGTAQVPPSFPAPAEMNIYFRAFFDRIHPMFPVLDMNSFQSDVGRMATQDLTMLRQEEVPLLACAYCVFALGADENAGHCTDISMVYLSAAFNIFAYIVSVPYLVSVQALILLTVALKARNKDGCGAQSLGQAIRIAQSLGLNHASVAKVEAIPGESVSFSDNNLDAHCWWVCYCLEQMFGLEIGRPIFIREVHCRQVMPTSTGHTGDFFGLWIRLAQIQSRLYEVLYARQEARSASGLLRDIGQIDRELCDWEAAVKPEEIRPTLDLLCPREDLHIATFLAAKYFQTLITVHQASLLLDPNTYLAKVELHCLNSPSISRLRSSEVIIINSARRIADLLLRLIDQNVHSTILGPTVTMMAIIILGRHIMKDAGERRNRADLELLTALSRHAETQYAESGQHPKFVEGLHIAHFPCSRPKDGWLIQTSNHHSAATNPTRSVQSRCRERLSSNNTSTRAERNIGIF
ncbi:hypothetical protein BDZ45DRAFT_673749 [Acephala macrosclerotiorum]|nr:hypothetical protein BDZ45DRAFT_673749 [Acephala macrosclerotiorum]